MAITQALVGTSATTVFTSVNNMATTALFFMNDNASGRNLTIHVVKSGETAAASNVIVKAITVNGGDTYVVNTEKLVLANGDTIQAVASASSSIYATVSAVSI